MSLKEFFLSHPFRSNLIAALAIFIILITVVLVGLRKYTNHGDAYAVPNLTGLTEDKVQELLNAEKLNYRIIDSAFISENNPGSVIDQYPKPGFKVKQNRTILLTINASMPEQVTLPKLRDISYRQALALIENMGFRLGNISFKPSEYNDLVLSVLSNSSEVYEGDMLTKGATIDLVIGKKSGLEKTTIPDLTGLSIGDAKVTILDALLNPGVIIYDESILTLEDSVNARIWKQRPNPRANSTIELGSSIDMWVTVDGQKINPTNEN
jgi:eukaryotic-like serine/threonine-protein kinase